ncbi:hypothetical protein LXA43DRAFT_901675 [Ganoderma leucocontextum]|nr:hypothetical protein LXA43DRAFT_901675 [Ganoderma leucocontextum]
MQDYLWESLRLEGRGDFMDGKCAGCSNALPDGLGVRCDDCEDCGVYCIGCCFSGHKCLPLHRMKRWNGEQFRPVSLSDLGLRFQLGHPPHEACPRRTSVDGSFAVLDITGSHEINMDYCGCDGAPPHHIQLLRQNWFPAACVEPRMAATFRLLRHFHLFSAHLGISAVDFYENLIRLTYNNGLNPPSNRSASFAIMAKEWQHLKMLKRSGHVSEDVAAAPTRADAVDRVASSRSINIVSVAANVARKSRICSWLSRFFPSLCTSKLKPQSGPLDYGLNDDEFDETFYTKLIAFHLYCDIASHALQRASFRRLNDSLLRSPSPDVRHEADDCAVSASLVRNHVRVHEQGDAYPFISFEECDDYSVLPTFALHSYVEYCCFRSGHIFTWHPRSNDGVAEGVRARLTGSESRPHVHPVDDVSGSQTWAKVTTLPAALRERVQFADQQHQLHVEVYQALCAQIPAKLTQAWLEKLERWEADSEANTDPSKPQRSHKTQKDVYDQLTELEVSATCWDDDSIFSRDSGLSEFLFLGLDIEEQQRQLRAVVSGSSVCSSNIQHAKLRCQHRQLLCRINEYRHMQEIFMPDTIASFRAEYSDGESLSNPLSLPLLLPSAVCHDPSVPIVLLEYEFLLREAQAYDALADLRDYLEVVDYLEGQLDANRQPVEAALSMLVSVLRAQIHLAAGRYRFAYASLSELAGALRKEHWQGHLRRLDDEHIQCLPAEGAVGSPVISQVRSWIWQLSGTPFVRSYNARNPYAHRCVALRVQWFQARARMIRSRGVCDFIRGELCRVVASFKSRARWWEERIDHNFEDCPDYREGANAYAYRQAWLRRSMRDRCIYLWRSVKRWMRRPDSYSMLPDLEAFEEAPTLSHLGGERASKEEGADGFV